MAGKPLTLAGLLPLLAAALAALDGAWLVLGHFALDGSATLRAGLLALALLAGARFYRTARPDPRLAAMLAGAGFLCAFSLGASLLNYMLLTRAGARIDMQLAALDRALGFDWPQAMAWMARHPRLNAIAYIAYVSMLPQVALLTIALGAAAPLRVYRFCFAVAASALVCIAVWSLAPSFGAFSIYPPDPHLAKMTLALDPAYARELVRLLKDGPGLISPREAKGLIGFPSYHAVLALLVIWFSWRLRLLRWPAILLNLAVLLATPIQGGHHLVDVLGAFPVAALALFACGENIKGAAKMPGMVNERPKLTTRPVPQGLFRVSATQNSSAPPNAIKSKLSGVS
jgi:hypothetical protein